MQRLNTCLVVKCAHLYIFFLFLFTLKYTSLIYTAYLRTVLYRDKMSFCWGEADRERERERERDPPPRPSLIILVECLEFLLQTKKYKTISIKLALWWRIRKYTGEKSTTFKVKPWIPRKWTGRILRLAIIKVQACSNNAKHEDTPKQCLVYDMHANSNIQFSVNFPGSQFLSGGSL